MINSLGVVVRELLVEMLSLVFLLEFPVAVAISSRHLKFCLTFPHPALSWNKHAECNGSMTLSSCVCVHIFTMCACTFVSMCLSCLLLYSTCWFCNVNLRMHTRSHPACVNAFLCSVFVTHSPDFSPCGFTPIKQEPPWSSSLHWGSSLLSPYQQTSVPCINPDPARHSLIIQHASQDWWMKQGPLGSADPAWSLSLSVWLPNCLFLLCAFSNPYWLSNLLFFLWLQVLFLLSFRPHFLFLSNLLSLSDCFSLRHTRLIALSRDLAQPAGVQASTEQRGEGTLT